MPAGFTSAFAQRLDGRLPFAVEEVTSNRPLTAGTVWIAPAGMHLRIVRERDALTASLGRYPETQHRPSVDVLFRSAFALAPRVVAVLLTGMGDDGARSMLELAGRGAFTIAQDEASCVVYGMPRAAMDLGAVCEKLPLSQIAPRLRQLLRS
jgi:two-component system chemotaxis response regulator CheB